MKTMLNIKTDVKLKKRAQEKAVRLGLPLSIVINNYLRRFIESEQVIFSEPLQIPNKKTARLLRRADKDIKAGRNLSPMFSTSNLEKMDNYLSNL